MPPSSTTPTRAVFFDAVGTLLFPEPAPFMVYAEVARRHGYETTPLEVRERFHPAYQAEDDIDRAAGWVTSEERERDRWRRIVAASLPGLSDPEVCFRELWQHFATSAAWRVNPTAGPRIAQLCKRGITLGIGSNFDARLLTVLNGFPELALLRDRVVVSAAVGFRKPAVEFFREVVTLAQCEPGEVLFVGDDRENDYDGAIAAGLQAELLSLSLGLAGVFQVSVP